MAEGALGQASLLLSGSALCRPARHLIPLFPQAPEGGAAPWGFNAGKLRKFGGGAAVLIVQGPKADAFKRYGVQAKSSKGQFCPLDNEVIKETVGTEADPQVDSGSDGVFDWGNAPLDSARNEFFDGVFSQLLGGRDLVNNAVTSAQQGYDTFAGGGKSSATLKRNSPEATLPQLNPESQVRDAPAAAPAAGSQAILGSPPLPPEQPPQQVAPAADAQGVLKSTPPLKRLPLQDAPPVDAKGIVGSPPSLLERLPVQDAPAVDAQSSVGSSPSLQQLPATLAPAQSVTDSPSGQDLWTSVQAVVANDPALVVRVAVVVVGALVVGALWSLIQGVLGSYKEEVTAEEALQALQEKGAALVDIRSKAEIALSGSPSLKSVGVSAIRVPTVVEETDGTLVWVPVPEFITALKGAKGLEAGGPVLVVLDKSGEEALKVVKLLKGGAFAKVLAVKGGADAWKESGLAWRKPKTILALREDLRNVKETITRSVIPLDLENVKETISDQGPIVVAVILGVAAASLVLFPGLRWVYDHFSQPNAYERQPVSQFESAFRLLGSIGALQIFSKRLLYAEDRKETLEQLQAYLRRKVAPQEADEVIEMGPTPNRRDSSGQISEEDKAEGDAVGSRNHRKNSSQKASTTAKGTDRGEVKNSATMPHSRARARHAEEPEQNGKSGRGVTARKEGEELVMAESAPVEPVMRKGNHVPIVKPKQEGKQEVVEEDLAAAAKEIKAEVKENVEEGKAKEPEDLSKAQSQEVKPRTQEVKAQTQEVKVQTQEVKAQAQEVKAQSQEVKPRTQEIKAQTQEVKAQIQEVKEDVERPVAELEVSPLVEVVKVGKQPEEEALPKQALASEPGEGKRGEGEEPKEHVAERRAAASAAVEEPLASGREPLEEEGEGAYIVQEGNDEVAARDCEEDISKRQLALQGLRKRRKAQQTSVRQQLTRHLSEHYRRRSEHR